MSRRISCCLLTAAIVATAAPTVIAQDSRAAADPASIVTAGHARFTVLTPQLVRLEWAADKVFEDRPSLVFINRRLPAPTFVTRRERGWTVIDTGTLVVRYRPQGTGEFSAQNLSIDLTVAGKPVTWRPGMADTGNLRGTTRTLDGVQGATSLEPGLVSRDGWVLVGDSLLVAPITSPVDESGMASQSVWLPPGTWVEWFTGATLQGPAKVDRQFGLDEIPVYVKAGAIVPLQPKMRHTSERPVDPLILTIFPGAAAGATRVYEDAGAHRRTARG